MSADELDDIQRQARLTALVLLDIAEHLSRGEVMNVGGEWCPEDRLEDVTRPHGRWARRLFERGRRQATADAIQALRWVADANSTPTGREIVQTLIMGGPANPAVERLVSRIAGDLR